MSFYSAARPTFIDSAAVLLCEQLADGQHVDYVDAVRQYSAHFERKRLPRARRVLLHSTYVQCNGGRHYIATDTIGRVCKNECQLAPRVRKALACLSSTVVCTEDFREHITTNKRCTDIAYVRLQMKPRPIQAVPEAIALLNAAAAEILNALDRVASDMNMSIRPYFARLATTRVSLADVRAAVRQLPEIENKGVCVLTGGELDAGRGTKICKIGEGILCFYGFVKILRYVAQRIERVYAWYAARKEPCTLFAHAPAR